MWFSVLAYLLSIAAGLQVLIVPTENLYQPSTEIVASMHDSLAPDVIASPSSSKSEREKQFFQSIGLTFSKMAHGMHEEEHVSPSERREAITKNREDLAMSRLNVLKAELPQLGGITAQLCSGANGVHLCEIRMKMFKSISDRIEQGDTKVVELLRKSAQLLQDFHRMTDTIRGAISSLTLFELKERPPEGMYTIADINPMDGNIDRYEWSEYMKAIYLFTLTDGTAHALEMKHKSGNRMKEFVSWDLRDEEPPKLGTESPNRE